MKKFIIKDTITNLETKEKLVYFTGKDDYVHDDIYFVDGYSRKHFAEQKIQRELNWYGGNIESKKWLHEYEILEISCDR